MPPSTAFQVVELPVDKAVSAIRAGLPAAAFDGIAKVLSLNAEDLAKKLGISLRTVRDQRKKTGKLLA